EQLDGWGARTAPHVYGSIFGPFACAHLAAAVDGFEFVEWDQISTPGFDTSAYRIKEGHLEVPDAPGFGLELDAERFRQAVAANGFSVGR
ncbi:MAG TPA: enolase C-terminal domain-like protein, partial [Thermomicrobiales bacterium]|nr:enolase C-terminal domain-like protein [Thermomicrobiales bacterium]